MSRVMVTGKIRVLVVDDSAYNRQAIVEMLESDDEIEVVGLASNGEEGIKEAARLRPDIITLDLEMPRMDGFTFLRILMSRQATPVIVISSYSRKQNVFKAMELGALDFIAKPTRYLSPEVHKIKDELLEKIRLVRQLRTEGLKRVSGGSSSPLPAVEISSEVDAVEIAVLAIGASTGGPQALQRVLQRVPSNARACYLVAQHMPEGFTRAFAERLNRLCGLHVCEAEGEQVLRAGQVLVAPGGNNLVVERRQEQLLAKIVEPAEDAKYVPSIDLLFSSLARAMGHQCMAILLTGMGSDGCQGMQAVKAAGGRTVAESEETAVVFGMPKEAIDSGSVDQIAHLDDIPSVIKLFLEKQGDGND
ncbi:MAG: chemotaxis response regulator protein-glutamate methylesterase [Deltaproteobacteria bacterium]|nr:MAG: chemotaxis response regulator protein-glutamate methylesterase [Deltaproteobacteria bacterium]